MTQIRALYERWLTLEAEKADLAADLRDLFAEAKGNGHDAKALRAAFREAKALADNPDAVNEHDALVSLYMAEIGTGFAIARNAREAAE